MRAVTYNNSVYLVIDSRPCNGGLCCDADRNQLKLHNPYTGYEFWKCERYVTEGDQREMKEAK